MIKALGLESNHLGQNKKYEGKVPTIMAVSEADTQPLEQHSGSALQCTQKAPQLRPTYKAGSCNYKALSFLHS